MKTTINGENQVAAGRVAYTPGFVTAKDGSNLGHAASWNSDRGGQPGPVAQELRRFFA